MHLYLVTVAWLYVVLMMALAEAMSPQGTILGALITLMLYGVLPLGIVLYILATPQRRRARRAAEAAARELAGADAAVEPTDPAAALPSAAPLSSAAPDGGRHAPGDAVAPERKET